MEDEDFLAAIRDRKIVLENGTNIRAIVRTIQRKKVRTRTDRTIVEVKELFPPGGVGQKSKQASPRSSHTLRPGTCACVGKTARVLSALQEGNMPQEGVHSQRTAVS